MFELTNRDLTALLEAINDSRITSFHLKTPQYEVSISCLDDGAAVEPARSHDNGQPSTPPPSPEPAGTSPEPAGTSPEPAGTSAQPPEAGGRDGTGPVPVQAQAPATTAAEPGIVAVTAPMVGAFYVAPEPGAAPYVQPGSTVTPETTVGLIEAMKVFTAVTAGVHGVVSAVLAKNGEFVEYGQELVLVAVDEHQRDAVDEDDGPA